MQSPLPTEEEACNVISQEESQRQTLRNIKEELEGLAMYSRSNPPVCSACGKTGHLKENGSVGITAQQLEQLLKLLPTPSKGGGGDTDDEMDANYAGAVMCNQARMEERRWILDSGATHHMTSCEDKLSNKEKLEVQPNIDLPNGDVAKVTHKGKAR
ncbi:Retrovirus-related Pol polyprotein from transposon RE2 [Bienertia sinuspersici]